MNKWLKVALAFLLFPLCVGAIGALARVLMISGQAKYFWIAATGGAACWFTVYALLPKPMWVYVFGHELTHALWTWLFGGKVKKFKVSALGGHVVITKSNFLIALAPYFFPLYTLLLVGIYGLGNWIWGWKAYSVWFHLLLGVTYAFHLSLTWYALKTEQSDITTQGFFFSAVVIVLGNLLVLLIGLPVLTGVPIWDAVVWWLRETGHFYQRVAAFIAVGRS